MSDERPEREGDAPRTERVRIRRAPRLGVFAVIGVVVGVVVSLILTSLFPVDPKIGFAALAGYFALYGIVIGGVVGVGIGLIADAVLGRRGRDITVTREVVGPADDAEREGRS